MQMAAVLAVGAVLGYLAASDRLSPFPRPCAGQLPAPAECSSGAKPACCDEVNKGQILVPANRFAPSGGAALPTTQTAPAPMRSAPAADKRPRLDKVLATLQAAGQRTE
jgi:hypothetical protein